MIIRLPISQSRFRFLREIFRFIFSISIFCYLLLYFIESLSPGSVNDFFDTNILLIIALISGVDVLLFAPKEEKTPQKIYGNNKFKEYAFSVFICLLAVMVLYVKARPLGVLAYVIAIGGGLLVIMLSYVVLSDYEGNTHGEN